MGIRKTIDKNIFISDFARKVTCESYNRKMQTFINEITCVDSIKDYAEFKKLIVTLPAQAFGSTYSIKRAYAENTLYGYAYNLMLFAGLENESMLYLPLLEHGIDLCDELDEARYTIGRSYIFQGNNKIRVFEEERKRNGYSIGPFIHYAKDYYSEEELDTLKKKMGKTLLVFPPHSTEYGGGDFITGGFDENLFRIAKDYDTVIASVFWIDTTDKYIEYLNSKGVQLVSSGFKLDNQFVSRMKTIIKMADTVIYPSLTSSIGYAYYFGKRVICLPSERNKNTTSRENQNQVTYDNIKYVDIFCKVFNELADLKSEAADELIDYYWGTSLVKSKKQIRDIYFENKRNIIKKLGF